MYTRCPECHSVFAVYALTLGQAGGVVCCGGCQKVFNSIENLFDEWPDSTTIPAASNAVSSMPPVLNPDPTDEQDFDLKTFQVDDQPATVNPVQEDQPAVVPRQSRLWLSACILLGVLLLGQISWSYRQSWAKHPTLEPLARALGIRTTEPVETRTPELIQLMARDMHPHPSIENAIIISATLVNRSQTAQPYPVLQVTLTDHTSEPVARRRFRPAEYLSAELDSGQLMPGTLLPVLLELNQPARLVTGFQIQVQ